MIPTSGRGVVWLALTCFVLLADAHAQASATGLRLLMFEEEECAYCALWQREVGVVYARTAEGHTAPLLRTTLDEELPGVTLNDPVRFTPTFVLLRDGRELGRITGYPGEAHFWGLLGDLLQRNTRG